jgi:hypothetical protein
MTNDQITDLKQYISKTVSTSVSASEQRLRRDLTGQIGSSHKSLHKEMLAGFAEMSDGFTAAAKSVGMLIDTTDEIQATLTDIHKDLGVLKATDKSHDRRLTKLEQHFA